MRVSGPRWSVSMRFFSQPLVRPDAVYQGAMSRSLIMPVSKGRPAARRRKQVPGWRGCSSSRHLMMEPAKISVKGAARHCVTTLRAAMSVSTQR
jgi:hypothetical protein